MKTRIFAIRLLLLTSILFTASCAAPTPLPTSTPTATRTSTPTAAPTATPTEVPLPEELRELQNRLGKDYKLVETGELDSTNNKIFSIQDKERQVIPDVKIFVDGTSELTYNFQGQPEDLTVAFQAITAENEALQIGPWQYKDAEWIMLTAAAPKTVEDVDSFPKLAYLKGHAKEKEIDQTIHRYVQMALTKSETYDPLDEFVMIDNGKAIDKSKGFEYIDYTLYNNLKGRPIYIDGAAEINGSFVYAQQIALGQGWTSLDVYDASGNKLYDLIQVPMVNIGTDPITISTSALMYKNRLPDILDTLNQEEKNKIFTTLIKVADIPKQEALGPILSDIKLREFMAYYNDPFFAMGVLKQYMEDLPPEVSTMLYFDVDTGD